MPRRGIHEVDRQRAIDAHNHAIRAQARPQLEPAILGKRLATREAAEALLVTMAANPPDVGEVAMVDAHLLRELCKIAQVHLADDDEVEVRDSHGPRRRTLLASWSAVLDYARQRYAFNKRETFAVVWLDKRNCVIVEEAMNEGTVDHAPVYPREVARRALETNASACILMHNHPSGDPAPSAADVDMTRRIVETLRPLGVAVHDHIVIGRDGVASLRALGRI